MPDIIEILKNNTETLKERIRTSPEGRNDDVRNFLCDLIDRTENLTKPVLFISRTKDNTSFYKDVYYAVQKMRSDNGFTMLDRFLADKKITLHMDSFNLNDKTGLGMVGYGVWITPDITQKTWPRDLSKVVLVDAAAGSASHIQDPELVPHP